MTEIFPWNSFNLIFANYQNNYMVSALFIGKYV